MKGGACNNQLQVRRGVVGVVGGRKKSRGHLAAGKVECSCSQQTATSKKLLGLSWSRVAEKHSTYNKSAISTCIGAE